MRMQQLNMQFQKTTAQHVAKLRGLKFNVVLLCMKAELVWKTYGKKY